MTVFCAWRKTAAPRIRFENRPEDPVEVSVIGRLPPTQTYPIRSEDAAPLGQRGLTGERHAMLLFHLHARGRNTPFHALKVEICPFRLGSSPGRTKVMDASRRAHKTGKRRWREEAGACPWGRSGKKNGACWQGGGPPAGRRRHRRSARPVADSWPKRIKA